ncbi:MAG: hypothetical protein ACTS73_09345 [Arsenophonus sp. NEOnobi-MAG3]
MATYGYKLMANIMMKRYCQATTTPKISAALQAARKEPALYFG